MDEIVYDSAPSPASFDSIKTMPNDPEAERSVLSAMLLSPDALESILVELKEDDFFVYANRVLFAAIRTMFERSITPDPITLADYLRSNDELDKVGGMGYVARLADD